MTDPSDRHTLRGPLPPEAAGARVAPDDEHVRDDKHVPDDGGKPSFDPYKFQRITLPPGLRADFIRWTREAREESVPEDTLPPNRGVAGNAGPPASVSRRTLAVWVLLLLSMALIAFVVAKRAREYMTPSAPPSELEPTATGSPTAEAPVLAPAPSATPTSTAAPSGAPPPELPHLHPSAPKRHVPLAKPAEPPSPPRAIEPPPEPSKGESALDRPFSTPP
jgi:hypothetical protein